MNKWEICLARRLSIPEGYMGHGHLRETQGVHTMSPKAVVNFRVVRYLSIVVLRPVQPAIRDIQRDGVVPRLRDSVPVIFQRLTATSESLRTAGFGTHL